MAKSTCSARAELYGVVHIIDVEQRSPSMIVVWGTTQNDQGRKSFKCSFGTKITSFTIRPIVTRP